MTDGLSPDAIAARTPADRDRVVDLVRLVAIGFVVVGHWLVAVVLVRDGELVDARLIEVVPATRAELPAVGYLNYLLVWGGIHQVGYLWHDRRLPRRPLGGLALAALGTASTLGLLHLAGYPVSVIALTGEPDNTDPPTLVLWTLAAAQLGVLLAVRPALARWLERPRVWAPVVLGGSVIMTVFLWHMTAMVVVAALTHPTGLWPGVEQVDGLWWAMRPVWLALCGLVLAGLVTAFRRFEEFEDPVPRHARVRTLVGLACSVGGLTLLLTGGLYTPQATGNLPFSALGLVLLGFASLGVLRPNPGAVRDADVEVSRRRGR